MVLAAVLLCCLLTAVAAHLCADGGGVTDGAICEQEGRCCGRCQCNASGTWACESPSSTLSEGADNDCASIDFHKEPCNDWQEGKSCGDCTCIAQKWVCSNSGSYNIGSAQGRELQGDEECQANTFEPCTELNSFCGNCLCTDFFDDALLWSCAGNNQRVRQCLGVENGTPCRWVERGLTCGDCECMPDTLLWSCPASSTSICENVDHFQRCLWKNHGSLCGNCFCVRRTWVCPETLCDNIFPGKFCLWKHRGRTCFGCECVDNRWVCPETTPTRQELCADDIFTDKFCRWRDEGRVCGDCLCRANRWACPDAEPCAMIADSCSGEHTIAVSVQDFLPVSLCILPAGLRGLELVVETATGTLELELYNAEWITGLQSGELVFEVDRAATGKMDYEQNPELYTNGASPGADQLEWNIGNLIETVAWNPDFPSRATVYSYEVRLPGSFVGTGTVTYRWACNEDPALACACALG